MNIGLDSMIVVYAGFAPTKTAATTEEAQKRKELALRAAFFSTSTKGMFSFCPQLLYRKFLCRSGASQRGGVTSALSERFNCPIFDLQAASIAADLWVRHKNLPPDQRYQSRQLLRANAMIVASAKAAGATCFYSHDKNCRTLAALVMTARRPTEAARREHTRCALLGSRIREGRNAVTP